MPIARITDKIGLTIYNGAVKRSNKFARGEYHVRDKLKSGAKAGARYIDAVGTNIVNDVTTGQSQMFPFQQPKQPKRQKRKLSNDQRLRQLEHEIAERKRSKKRRKQPRQTYKNPYPLI